jgi:hypothetical protein
MFGRVAVGSLELPVDARALDENVNLTMMKECLAILSLQRFTAEARGRWM